MPGQRLLFVSIQKKEDRQISRNRFYPKKAVYTRFENNDRNSMNISACFNEKDFFRTTYMQFQFFLNASGHEVKERNPIHSALSSGINPDRGVKMLPDLEILKKDGYYIVNKKLIHALGLDESLLISHLIYMENYFAEKGKLKDGWFFAVYYKIAKDLNIKEWKVRTMVKEFCNLGLIETEMKHGRQYYLINRTAIAELIRNTHAKNQRGKHDTPTIKQGADPQKYKRRPLKILRDTPLKNQGTNKEEKTRNKNNEKKNKQDSSRFDFSSSSSSQNNIPVPNNITVQDDVLIVAKELKTMWIKRINQGNDRLQKTDDHTFETAAKMFIACFKKHLPHKNPVFCVDYIFKMWEREGVVPKHPGWLTQPFVYDSSLPRYFDEIGAYRGKYDYGMTEHEPNFFRDEDGEPILNKDGKPILNEDDESILNKDDESILNKDDEPILNKDWESILNKDWESIINKW
jgi:hypothetical protein